MHTRVYFWRYRRIAVGGSNRKMGQSDAMHLLNFLFGLLVKWLSHHPVTVESLVQSQDSPFGRIAQWPERLPYMQKVDGSIPSSSMWQ